MGHQSYASNAVLAPICQQTIYPVFNALIIAQHVVQLYAPPATMDIITMLEFVNV